jgi:NADPH-dependent 2,4-dienoyl-CoA reductase/sulfur reductase-like enzyme
MTQTELAIVGAGPAGLAAAVAAAEAGVKTTLIDSYPQPGGQYFKQLPADFAPENDRATHQAEAEPLFGRLGRAGVRLLVDTLVWGAFPEPAAEGQWQLTMHGPEAPARLQSQALILATGAYDRPIAFPGWTLPGVMTAGAVQNLLKSQRVLPGRRFVLAGTGPLQLAVASHLVRAGAEVVAVLEGARPGLGHLKHTLAMRGQGSRLREGWDYWRSLRRAGVPLRLGWGVVAAEGEAEVETVRVARLDDEWRPVAGSEESLAADTLVIGYGFLPSTELSRLLGCEQEFRPGYGGDVPRRDEWLQTSLPGVYAVGDGAGLGGAELARLEGRLAGLAVARRLGQLSETALKAARRSLAGALARERRFARMLAELFSPAPGLYHLADEETLICRCEEVSLAQIKEVVRGGARTVNEVKGLTRCGMGNCQGRICGQLAAHAIVAAQGRPGGANYWAQVDAAGRFSVRPPIHPLPLGVLAEAAAAFDKISE